MDKFHPRQFKTNIIIKNHHQQQIFGRYISQTDTCNHFIKFLWLHIILQYSRKKAEGLTVLHQPIQGAENLPDRCFQGLPWRPPELTRTEIMSAPQESL